MTTLKDISLSMLDLVSVREGGTVAEALAISLRTALAQRHESFVAISFRVCQLPDLWCASTAVHGDW
jgi:hypothetical protein